MKTGQAFRTLQVTCVMGLALVSSCTFYTKDSSRHEPMDIPASLVGHMENRIVDTLVDEAIVDMRAAENETQQASIAGKCLATIHESVNADLLTRDRLISIERLRMAGTRLAQRARLESGHMPYNERLQYYTTTELTPSEVNDRAMNYLDSALQSVNGNFTASQSMPHALPDIRTENAKQQLLDLAGNYVIDGDDISRRLTHLSAQSDLDIQFTDQAKGGYVPAHRADAATLLLNPRLIREEELEAYVFRFSVPGHHLIPRSPLDEIVRYDGFDQGWGLYAAELASLDTDNGARQSGVVSMLATEAAAAVVDTGINALGWSDDDALELLNRLQISRAEADNVVVTARTSPGQASAGFVGFSILKELNASVRLSLQGRFSLAEFNDIILASGPRPLPVVARAIKSWLQTLDAGRIEEDDP